jgi:AraC family transcriptional regulator, transcriptional activator of pobA
MNMRSSIISDDKKVPAFRIQALETFDGKDLFQEGTPLQLGHYEFIWIKKGLGSLTVDVQDYMFSENVIYFLVPGQWRTLNQTDTLEGYYISLSADFFFTVNGEIDYIFLIDKLTRGRNIMLLMPESERVYELNDIIQLMKKEYDRNALSRIDILSGFLKVFMLYISKNLSINRYKFKLDEKSEKVMKFLTLVKRNFQTKRMVADYASEMALSPSYLNNLVKKISGFSASYHIQQCIILEAKRQIVTEKVRMKELVYSLGFYDCAHFSKYFKNKCGMSFSSFRNDLNKV